MQAHILAVHGQPEERCVKLMFPYEIIWTSFLSEMEKFSEEDTHLEGRRMVIASLIEFLLVSDFRSLFTMVIGCAPRRQPGRKAYIKIEERHVAVFWKITMGRGLGWCADMEVLTKDLKENWRQLYSQVCTRTGSSVEKLLEAWTDETFALFEHAALKAKVEFETKQKVKWEGSAKTMFKNHCVMKVSNLVTAALASSPQTSVAMAMRVLQSDAQQQAGALSMWQAWWGGGHAELVDREASEQEVAPTVAPTVQNID